MFYLLEDNRIIDSESLPLTYYEKGCLFRITEYNNKMFRKTNIGTIKKQSENVFDLIEVGDLVRYKTKCLGKEYLYTMEIIEKDFIDYAKRDFYNILALYKPNTKGDYIKVWEKGKDK